MSDAAAALAAPGSITYGDKEYPLSPLSIDMIAMFERWAENRAYDTIAARKGHIADDDYERLLSAWVEQCTSGRYKWGKTACARLLRTDDGMAFLLFLQLAEKTPTMTQPLARKILEKSFADIQAKMEVVNAPPFDAPAPMPAKMD